MKFEEDSIDEVLLNSIDQDGTMEGYDFELIKSVTQKTSIPIVVVGGTGSYSDFKRAVN